MLKNYWIIAWRSLNKQRFYSLLNIIGLSIGLASCLIIFCYVTDELGYDQFVTDPENTYRIDADIKFGADEVYNATVPAPLAEVLQEAFPQVLTTTRLYKPQHSALVRRKGDANNQMETNLLFSDSTFFTVFPIHTLSGSLKSALNEPYTAVLTKAAAIKYFGSQEVINNTLVIDDGTPYRITAVIDDVPAHSHLAGTQLFLSMRSLPISQISDWVTHRFNTYIHLQEGTDVKAFEKNMNMLIEKFAASSLRQHFDLSLTEFQAAGNRLYYTLFPVTDIHLHSQKAGEIGVNGDIRYIYIFSLIALFLLMIACVNFMNLTTARSAGRAREVGIRKTLGSSRGRLIIQFLTESVLITYLSLFLSIAIALATLPYFNELSGKQLTLPYQSPFFWVILSLAGIIVGLFAGSYPAFFLSSFTPLLILKNLANRIANGWSLRNILVIFQFTISVVLIAGTGIIYSQLHFIRTKPLGFDKSQVLIVNDAYPIGNHAQSFKQAVLEINSVQQLSWSGYLPTPSDRRYDAYSSIHGSDNRKVNMQSWWVDENYIETLGLQLLDGRGFSKNLPTDSSGVILNETAAQLLGYDQPIGKQVTRLVDSPEKRLLTIIGVVKDFHFESLRENIGPVALLLQPHTGSAIIRLKDTDVRGAITQIKELWDQFVPGQPFSYYFLDESFNQMYQSELQMGRLCVFFAALAIFIACLGLSGLAAFVTEQRTKEIGIRKVLGATINSIVSLLTTGFVKLVLIAILIAVPITWWIMNKWLQDFAYRITIQWWMFAAAGVVAVVIAMLTVSWQAIRSAVANPVDSLRDE